MMQRIFVLNSATDYCTIELISAAKFIHYSLQGTEAIFNVTHRGHLILPESQSHVIIKRSSGHKRYYPPQFKHPTRIGAARVLRDNLF